MARKLKTSNNFVLQAACRCLRQVPGNNHPASIYLSEDNRKTLDSELRETYGESLLDLDRAASRSKSATIRLHKLDLPPLVIKRIITKVVPAERPSTPLALTRPEIEADGLLTVRSFDLSAPGAHSGVLVSDGEVREVRTAAEALDLYTVATKLAAVYRLDPLELKARLAVLYPDGDVPSAHVSALAAQVEEHTSAYTTEQEEIEVALALVKPEGFTRSIDSNGLICYTAEITYPRDREHLLKFAEDFAHNNSGDFSFHYSPYNFDSKPEAEYFEALLAKLNLAPGEIDDFYFTGALTSASKSDLRVEYKDVNGKWRDYTPDFVIRRKDGKCLLVEIKKADPTILGDLENVNQGNPGHTTEGRKHAALKRWEELNPEALSYQMVTVADSLPLDATDHAATFAR